MTRKAKTVTDNIGTEGADSGIAPAPDAPSATAQTNAALTSGVAQSASHGGADADLRQHVEQTDIPSNQLARTTSPTKLARVMQALQSPAGATLAHLGALTGWQAHSIRAALSGLRKAGHAVTTGKNDEGVTVYRIASARIVAEAGAAETGSPTEEPQAGGASGSEGVEPREDDASGVVNVHQPAGAAS